MPALAQQPAGKVRKHEWRCEDAGERERWNDRYSDRGVKAGAPKACPPKPQATRPGDPNPYATRAGDPNPYATRAGDPNPYATKAGTPNPYATKAGAPRP